MRSEDTQGVEEITGDEQLPHPDLMWLWCRQFTSWSLIHAQGADIEPAHHLEHGDTQRGGSNNSKYSTND